MQNTSDIFIIIKLDIDYMYIYHIPIDIIIGYIYYVNIVIAMHKKKKYCKYFGYIHNLQTRYRIYMYVMHIVLYTIIVINMNI